MMAVFRDLYKGWDLVEEHHLGVGGSELAFLDLVKLEGCLEVDMD